MLLLAQSKKLLLMTLWKYTQNHQVQSNISTDVSETLLCHKIESSNDSCMPILRCFITFQAETSDSSTKRQVFEVLLQEIPEPKKPPNCDKSLGLVQFQSEVLGPI